MINLFLKHFREILTPSVSALLKRKDEPFDPFRNRSFDLCNLVDQNREGDHHRSQAAGNEPADPLCQPGKGPLSHPPVIEKRYRSHDQRGGYPFETVVNKAEQNNQADNQQNRSSVRFSRPVLLSQDEKCGKEREEIGPDAEPQVAAQESEPGRQEDAC